MSIDLIGREINGVLHKPKKQLAMVFDLNKCLGCHTCAMSCKTLWTDGEGQEDMWWNVVNTMPGKGTPKGWEDMGGGFQNDGTMRPGQIPKKGELGEAWQFNQKDVFYNASNKGSEKVHLKPTEKPDWGPNWDEDQGAGEYPNGYYFYLPRICNHCTHPACIEACPRGAIYKREEDGIVLINEDRCKGFRFCVEACPYKRIYFNRVREVSQKCIFCYPRVEKGVAPACARQCPGRLRFVGYLDDEESLIYKLVHKWKVALPLHSEYGTQPNVFYVPPMSPPQIDANGQLNYDEPRIPTEYLRELFGPRVDEVLETLYAEIDKKRNGGKSELLETLIVYQWPEQIFPDLTVDPATL